MTELRKVAVYPGETVTVPLTAQAWILTIGELDGEPIVKWMDSDGKHHTAEIGGIIEASATVEILGIAEPRMPITSKLYWAVRSRLGW